MSKKIQKEIDKISAYKRFFSGDDGKKILFDLMKQGNMLYTSQAGNSNETSFNEGKRFVVLHILKQVNTDTENLLQLINQAKEEDKHYALTNPI